jgi:hypothetical protein
MPVCGSKIKERLKNMEETLVGKYKKGSPCHYLAVSVAS